MPSKTTMSLLSAIRESAMSEAGALRDAIFNPGPSSVRSFAVAREKRKDRRLDIDFIVSGAQDTTLPTLREITTPAIKIRRLSKQLGSTDDLTPMLYGVDMNGAAFGALVQKFRLPDMTDRAAAMHVASRLLDQAEERGAQGVPHGVRMSVPVPGGKVHAITRVREAMRVDDYVSLDADEQRGPRERARPSPAGETSKEDVAVALVSATSLAAGSKPLDVVARMVAEGNLRQGDPRVFAAVMASAHRERSEPGSDAPGLEDDAGEKVFDQAVDRLGKSDRDLRLRARALVQVEKANPTGQAVATGFEEVGLAFAARGEDEAALHLFTRAFDVTERSLEQRQQRAVRRQDVR